MKQKAIYAVTTCAILEVAERVFNVGSGVTKLDMTAFTLNRIKNLVEKIDKKVDIILKTPFLDAVNSLESAITLMKHEMFEDAYDNLRRVEDNAKTAFNYASQNEKSKANFRASINAVKLLVFSKVLRYSYDKERKIFLPHGALKKNIKVAISEELEELVNKCLVQSEKMKKKLFFRSKKMKEKKIEDTVDAVLTMTFPYISEGRGWIKINKETTEDTATSVEVTVKPQFIPEGEEDRTECVIGTIQGGTSLRAEIWRSEGCVVVKFPHCRDTIKFSSLQDEVKKTLKVWPQYLIVSSVGVTADSILSGDTFGQYEYRKDHNEIPYYRQRHTVDNKATALNYIYRGPDRKWWVGWKHGEKEGRLYNESISDSVPRSGWRSRVGPDDWRDDQELSVTPGELDNCGTITISGAEESPQCNGDYSSIGQFCRGVLVFKHSSRALYLCCLRGGSQWRLTRDVSVTEYLGGNESHLLQSSAAALCPGRQGLAWQYNNHNVHKACIKVVCSKHKD